MITVAFVKALVGLAERTIVAAVYHAGLPVVWGLVLYKINADLALGICNPGFASISWTVEESEVFGVIFWFYETYIARLCLIDLEVAFGEAKQHQKENGDS